MSNSISITLTDEQVQTIKPIIDEVADANGMILGTVRRVNGEIVATFETVSHQLGLEIIEIAGGKTNA